MTGTGVYFSPSTEKTQVRYTFTDAAINLFFFVLVSFFLLYIDILCSAR